jgi:DNA-binding SARP family transcriptional activator
MLRLRTLGSPRLSAPDGERLTGRRKELALLAYVALHAPRPLSRVELATLLWGERDDARARHSLRQALLRLRREIGDALVVDTESVSLGSDAIDLDTTRLDRELASGRVREALAHWRGDFLAGFEDVGGEAWRWWVEAERQRRRRVLAAALEQRVHRARADADWNEALAFAADWAELCPDDERAARHHIEAMRDADRVDEALRLYRAFVERLRRELEIEPSDDFVRLGAALEERDAREAREPAPSAIPGSVALFTPAMIGRAPALAELRSAWTATTEGGSTTVVVEGEAGIGKTLLCEEFLASLPARTDSPLVLRTRARSEDTGPWSTVRELVRSVLAAPALGGVSGETLAALARIAPELRDRFPHLPDADVDDAALAPAFIATLGVLAEDDPVVVFVDDAPLADRQSRSALLALLHAAPPGLFVLLTVRTGAFAGRDLLRDLSQVRGRRHLRLGPLAPGEIDVLLQSMLDLPAAERRALGARLHAESRGNPFYAVEIVFALVDEGRLAPDAHGIWRAAAGVGDDVLPLPHGVREAVERRLTGLPDAARELAGAAAVAGEPVDPAMIARLLGWAPGAFESAFEELLVRRLLRESPAQRGRYEFVHPMVRRVAYESVDVEHRQALHRAVAARLTPAAGTDPDLLALARHHRERGGEEIESARRPWGARTVWVAAAVALLAIAVAWVLGRPVRSPPSDLAAIPQGAPARQLAETTTTSLVAYRFYEEGLRRFAVADYRAALQFFEAALADDSTFALAAFNVWRARRELGLPTAPETIARMRRLAARARDRDRLLIDGSWALAMNEPMLSPVAETLAIRYPAEPEGQYLVGMSRFWGGDFPGALSALRRVVAMDSLGLRGDRASCLSCDALTQVAYVLIHTDSLAVAERELTTWLRLQPASARAWQVLANVLLFEGRVRAASDAHLRAMQLHPINVSDDLFPAYAPIYAGAHAEADRLLRDAARTAAPAVRQEASWFLTISLREQGRLEEARATLRRHDSLSTARGVAVNADPGRARHEGQILLEQGRFREAGDVFVRHARSLDRGMSPGFAARQRALDLTQAAVALAASGDTASLAALADSIEAAGRASAFGRDRRLHHHVRGLLLAARGALDDAVREFRLAMFSPTSGYTRTNLELGRVLLRQGRAADAIAIVAPALRGPLDASNLFVTRTELLALLARAEDAAGRRDSAVVHYRRVLETWRDADASFATRRDSIAARLEALGAP